MTFTPPNPFGVLDHAVHPNRGPAVRVPIRVLENLQGCEVLFSVFRPEGVSDGEFDADVELVQSDLLALKRLLESA